MFGLSEDVVALIGTGVEPPAQEIYQGVYPSWYDEATRRTATEKQRRILSSSPFFSLVRQVT